MQQPDQILIDSELEPTRYLSLYPVDAFEPLPSELCPIASASKSFPAAPGSPVCPLCATHAACTSLAAAAGALAAACLGGRCMAVRTGPLINRTNGPRLSSLHLAPDGAVGPVAMVLEAESEAELTIVATAFWEAALCRPGQASRNQTFGVDRGPLPFVAYQPGPIVQVPAAGVAEKAAADMLAGGEVVVKGCAPCPRGSWTTTTASTMCMLCAAGTFASGNGSTGCKACAAGSYAPVPGGAAVCSACPVGTPRTLRSGAMAVTACFAASITVQRAWAVGSSISFVIDWSFAPAAAAGAADIVSLVKLGPEGSLGALPPGRSDGGPGRRQLAWAYTSLPASPVDTDPDPGPNAEPGPEPVPVGSRTFTIPSAGPGVYAALLYRNSTGPAVPSLVADGGDIVALHRFEIGGTVPTLVLAGSMMPAADAVALVLGGGLVCPAGSISLLPGVGWPPCTPCPQGTAAITASSTVCAVCPAATYSDSPASGATSCVECPSGPAPPAGSPLLQPEWAGACSTCNLCCDELCYRDRNTSSRLTTRTSSRSTPSPTLMSVSTSAASLVTMQEVITADKALSTSSRHLDLTFSTPPPRPPPPPPPDGNYGWRWTCGNGVLNVYETSCWYC
jgi:hypothetical protein